MKDQNQLRNLALRVAQPTGVKALDKAGKSGKFTGFIEMETHALALELFEQIKEEEKEVDVTWAKESVLKVAESASVRKFKRAVQNWDGKKSVVLVSTAALTEADIRQMLKSSKDEAVCSSIGIKVAAAAISGTFYHELRFPSAEMALEFFQESFENPTSGIRVEVAGNAMETSTHLTTEQTEELVQRGELVVGVLRVSPANYNTAFVSDPAGGTDYVIATRALQNRALSGDKVAIKILPEDQWTRNKNGVQQRTAEVKAIVESKSIKRCAG